MKRIELNDIELNEIESLDGITVEDMSILQKAHMITSDGTIIPLEK